MQEGQLQAQLRLWRAGETQHLAVSGSQQELLEKAVETAIEYYSSVHVMLENEIVATVTPGAVGSGKRVTVKQTGRWRESE